jgi:hypothetical protein
MYIYKKNIKKKKNKEEIEKKKEKKKIDIINIWISYLF